MQAMRCNCCSRIWELHKNILQVCRNLTFSWTRVCEDRNVKSKTDNFLLIFHHWSKYPPDTSGFMKWKKSRDLHCALFDVNYAFYLKIFGLQTSCNRIIIWWNCHTFQYSVFYLRVDQVCSFVTVASRPSRIMICGLSSQSFHFPPKSLSDSI